jgi:uncharacterized protein YbjQ (UPF0145 family)
MTQQPPGYLPPQPQYPQQYSQQYPQQYPQPHPQQFQQPTYQQQQAYQQSSYPQPQDVSRIAPPWSPYPVLVVTTNELPGYRIERVFGHAYGLTVRTGAIGSNLGAGFKALGGGEVMQFTQMITEWRHIAVMRMAEMARQMGANAVLAMRFECEDVSQMAYGTAVLARPVDQDDPADTAGSAGSAGSAEEGEDAVDG